MCHKLAQLTFPTKKLPDFYNCCTLFADIKAEIKVAIKLVMAVHICILVLEKSDWLILFASVLLSVNLEGGSKTIGDYKFISVLAI